MDPVVFFGAVLGSTGLFSTIQYLISRHDNKKGELTNIRKALEALEQQGMKNELATTRLQLLWLMQSQPANHDTILRTAQRYFVGLDGDAEAFDEFDKWRVNEKVSIGWFDAVLAKETKRKELD